MSPVLRVGVVGFGRLARNYYSPALRAARCTLQLHIADPAPQSLAAAQRQWPDASTHRDHRELLAAGPLDALLVASPPSTHLAVWRDATARNLPVFMEKPFPLAGELSGIDPADASWSRIMIDFNRRFWPPYQRVAGLVRAGEVGAVKTAHFRLRVDPRKWSSVSNHRAQPGEGGALQDLGSQVLDLAIMVLGEVPLQLRTATAATNEGDLYRVELDFGSGADSTTLSATRISVSVVWGWLAWPPIGKIPVNRLADFLESDDALLRARALKAAGELPQQISWGK